MNKKKDFAKLIRAAGSGFGNHKVHKLSASLAFYTVFSLGPMMLVIIFFSNLFWGRQAIDGSIYRNISSIVGNTAASQIQEIIKNAPVSGHNFLAFINLLILLVAATTVFTEMQDSMNVIWNLKVRKGSGWRQMLKKRFLSFSMVTGLGLLLFVSLIINGLLEGFMDRLHEAFPNIGFAIIYIVNLLITFLVVSFLFAFIFKVLPDAVIRWKDVLPGAIFAAVLFMIGKFGISFYINHSNIGSSYGPAGSLVVLLLWIYYSAISLYFGAEFTKAYALLYGSKIKPKDYAVAIRIVNVESTADSIQQNEQTEAAK